MNETYLIHLKVKKVNFMGTFSTREKQFQNFKLFT